ncbi:MAG: hypothetical protein ABI607_11820 [Betaproteobacteria bacterium]
MQLRDLNKPFLTTTLAALVFGALLIEASPAKADDDRYDSRNEREMIRIGFEIAASSGIALNIRHKDPRMVGLGSYLVNVIADCNGCHSPPQTSFAPSGNPYFLPGAHPPFFSGKKQVNPATYLGGNQSFGVFPGGVEIISRNLTPDKSGRPVGGHTLGDFLLIMRTGTDLDHAHPSCSATITTNCIAFPFNGDLLQVMPWPAFQNMTDHDLEAVYVYLGAIRCLEGGPGEPPNRCK